MTEIFREIDEALTYDRLRALWRKYRLVMIASIFVALVFLFGFLTWRSIEADRLERSGELFFELLENRSNDDSLADLEDLRGGYKILWSFKRARFYAESGDLENARVSLERVSSDSSLDSLYRGYAQLWQASLLIEQGDDLAGARKLLLELSASRSSDESSLQALALYLLASVAIEQGSAVGDIDIAMVRGYLDKALSLGALSSEIRTRIEQAQRAVSTERVN